ncbi:rhomboid family intramembrane serine protease [Pseudolysinimonas yzui]|uniref:Rhomboid family intramembrane serine protease n=1 Tax=Pseudolysinimonas yzui TaxID=2708254 RepID=A0A8J3DSP0_9MICO|nr:rhomboid family intramembrane serine protease [Pseudolysinimonas yzui]GHF05489.1 rhomboid family intramembrane serine protease [Pseudolysinimonas yzui]
MTDSSAVEAPPTCYRHPDRATYISCQRCGRPICPECSTQAAVGVHCPECVREGRPAGGSGLARALTSRRSAAVTYTLMGLIVVAYAVQWLSGGALTSAWVLNPTVVGAEPWRLFTSAFLHSPGTIIHILFNLYALWAFGPALESFLGRVRFLALYLTAALGGSVGVLALYALAIATDGASIEVTGGFLQPSSALGASGAIFGLMGAYLPLRRAIGVNVIQLLIVLGVNVLLGFIASGIAWEAHLGGLLAGAAIGWVFLRTRRTSQRRAQILGVAGIAVGLLVVFVLFVVSAPAYYGL